MGRGRQRPDYSLTRERLVVLKPKPCWSSGFQKNANREPSILRVHLEKTDSYVCSDGAVG